MHPAAIMPGVTAVTPHLTPTVFPHFSCFSLTDLEPKRITRMIYAMSVIAWATRCVGKRRTLAKIGLRKIISIDSLRSRNMNGMKTGSLEEVLSNFMNLMKRASSDHRNSRRKSLSSSSAMPKILLATSLRL